MNPKPDQTIWIARHANRMDFVDPEEDYGFLQDDGEIKYIFNLFFGAEIRGNGCHRMRE